MSVEKAILAALEPIEGFWSEPGPLESLKNARAPFVFYLQIHEDSEESLEGDTELQEAYFEVNIVARTYQELLQLAGEARRNLHAVAGRTYGGTYIERCHIVQTSPDLKERETGLYRRMYVLQIQFQEEA